MVPREQLFNDYVVLVKAVTPRLPTSELPDVVILFLPPPPARSLEPAHLELKLTPNRLAKGQEIINPLVSNPFPARSLEYITRLFNLESALAVPRTRLPDCYNVDVPRLTSYPFTPLLQQKLVRRTGARPELDLLPRQPILFRRILLRKTEQPPRLAKHPAQLELNPHPRLTARPLPNLQPKFRPVLGLQPSVLTCFIDPRHTRRRPLPTHLLNFNPLQKHELDYTNLLNILSLFIWQPRPVRLR